MRKRRRFAPSASALEPRYALDAEGCDCDTPPAEVVELELPDVPDIFAPAPEDLIPPPLPDDPPPEDWPDDQPDEFVDTLPRLVPLGPAPPDLEDGQPPFVPLPPAPIGPAGPV